jgi:hypothetical protein
VEGVGWARAVGDEGTAKRTPNPEFVETGRDGEGSKEDEARRGRGGRVASVGAELRKDTDETRGEAKRTGGLLFRVDVGTVRVSNDVTIGVTGRMLREDAALNIPATRETDEARDRMDDERRMDTRGGRLTVLVRGRGRVGTLLIPADGRRIADARLDLVEMIEGRGARGVESSLAEDGTATSTGTAGRAVEVVEVRKVDGGRLASNGTAAREEDCVPITPAGRDEDGATTSTVRRDEDGMTITTAVRDDEGRDETAGIKTGRDVLSAGIMLIRRDDDGEVAITVEGRRALTTGAGTLAPRRDDEDGVTSRTDDEGLSKLIALAVEIPPRRDDDGVTSRTEDGAASRTEDRGVARRAEDEVASRTEDDGTGELITRVVTIPPRRTDEDGVKSRTEDEILGEVETLPRRTDEDGATSRTEDEDLSKLVTRILEITPTRDEEAGRGMAGLEILLVGREMIETGAAVAREVGSIVGDTGVEIRRTLLVTGSTTPGMLRVEEDTAGRICLLVGATSEEIRVVMIEDGRTTPVTTEIREDNAKVGLLVGFTDEETRPAMLEEGRKVPEMTEIRDDSEERGLLAEARSVEISRTLLDGGRTAPVVLRIVDDTTGIIGLLVGTTNVETSRTLLDGGRTVSRMLPTEEGSPEMTGLLVEDVWRSVDNVDDRISGCETREETARIGAEVDPWALEIMAGRSSRVLEAIGENVEVDPWTLEVMGGSSSTALEGVEEDVELISGPDTREGIARISSKIDPRMLETMIGRSSLVLEGVGEDVGVRKEASLGLGIPTPISSGNFNSGAETLRALHDPGMTAMGADRGTPNLSVHPPSCESHATSLQRSDSAQRSVHPTNEGVYTVGCTRLSRLPPRATASQVTSNPGSVDV